MEDIERIQSRLDNMRTVEPILDALQTISIGNWQLALRQQGRLREYRDRLHAVLSALTPHLMSSRRKGGLLRHRQWFAMTDTTPDRRIAVLIVGSERGLCGSFNAALMARAGDHVRALRQDNCQVELLALGARLVRLIRRREWELAWSGPLSVTSLPPFSIAWELSRCWLADYEAHRLDAVDLVYNAYHKPGVYAPAVVRLLPPKLPPVVSEPAWPPPIVETDPLRLYARAIEQWAALHLYQVLLESAASEHSTRFQLMEAATQNAERLIAELTELVQSARKQAITQEMQELAVGAGLIGPVTDR